MKQERTGLIFQTALAHAANQGKRAALTVFKFYNKLQCVSISAARINLRQGYIGARLVSRLPSFLKEPIHPSRAKEIVHNRLEWRKRDFLHLLKACVYDRPNSPYLRLLKMAGCEYGDAELLVKKEGVEGALRVLFHKGVYLTSKEFQGRRTVVRGSSSFCPDPQAFTNPLAKRHVPIKSSGSRSSGTAVEMDLAFLQECAVDTVIYLDARRSLASEKANWEVPGGSALLRLLTLCRTGIPPVHWFTQLDPRSQKLGARYHASSLILKFGGLLAHTPVPLPQHVSLEDPLPIARWMEACLHGGRTPHLFTFASSAVRLCRSAQKAGIDLSGAQITMSGEPTTEARLNSVRQSHAEALPSMGTAECGWVGYGCLAPNAPDDMHLLTDLHAVIQPGDGVQISTNPELHSNSLLLSTLRETAPLIMLNVSLGDLALLETRNCHCPMGELGLLTHIKYVRSFEKLTSGGMAFSDTDIIQILEKVLPQHFGGGPTDYQLIEDEHLDGEPHLRLVVHPGIGPLDERTVKRIFLDTVASASAAEKMTSLIWQVGSRLSIERSKPRTTSTGKIQHMHIERTELKSGRD